MSLQLRTPLTSLFTHLRLRVLLAKESAALLETITQLIDSGAITPALDRTCPLAAAPEAIAQVGAGHTKGKIAITI